MPLPFAGLSFDGIPKNVLTRGPFREILFNPLPSYCREQFSILGVRHTPTRPNLQQRPFRQVDKDRNLSEYRQYFVVLPWVGDECLKLQTPPFIAALRVAP
jgi:hypothetical protein